METVYRSCTLCEACCGLTFEVEGGVDGGIEGGRIASVRPDEEDVLSRGYICPKGIANAELHHDPDRLRGPVRRTPEGGFVPISWPDAMALATDGLRRVRDRGGKNAVGVYFGNPVVHNPGALLLRAGVTHALKTRNSFSAGSQDTSPRFAASHHLYGSSFTIPIPDLARTDHLLCLGANPLVSNGSFLTAPDMRGRLRALRARGGRLVVVDPRYSETAREADEHVAILPGGDAALLLGMVRVLIDDERIDRGAIDAVARGFADVERQIRALHLPDLADACGLPSETLARLAREFADATTSTAYSRIGICNNRFGTLATYAGDLLNLVAGRLGEHGGAVFARPALDINRILALPGMDGHGRWRSRVRDLPETVGDLPAACLAEEIETEGEGQIRALLVYAGNPVLSTPNGRRLDGALSRLDFMVSVDIYVNETNRHADVILPPASPLCEEHFDVVYPSVMIRNVARVSPAVAPKGANEKHDWEILRDLAEGLGGGMLGMPGLDHALRGLRALGKDLTPNDVLDLFLRSGPHGDHFLPFSSGLNLEKLRAAPHGIDLGDLEAGVRDRVRHRDGLVHFDAAPLLEALADFSSQIQQKSEPGDLLLIGRRDLRSNNTWLHNLPSLMRGKERCLLRLHPDDAKAAGLRDGDHAWLESRVHAGEVPIEITDEMRPGVVSLPHGWGHAAPWQKTANARPGVSANDWTDDGVVESVVGQSIMNGVPVRISSLDTRSAAEASPA